MNGTYFKNPSFPEAQNSHPFVDPDFELRLLKNNLGKKIKVYVTFPDSNEWRDRIFSGIIENVSEHYLILSDPASGNWHLVLLKFLAYIEFEEKLIF